MAGVGIAGVAAVSLADQSIRTQMRHLNNGSAKDVASQIRLFGSYYSYATIGLFYVGGEIFHDPPAKAVFIDSAAATLVASGIITPVLKYTVGRARPRAGQGDKRREECPCYRPCPPTRGARGVFLRPFLEQQRFLPVRRDNPGLCSSIGDRRAL
jgi:hypothetical protein